ncbi:hypothetical protein FE783_19295 [Paenibacillus mesophilus]|uniref:hypothetical protein n=1 Tax=Paenibacillus mesophilus TaxID=2582849 RepID=UPI00110E441B|nr:hypothetical protein [Paenibacillus mesophilus]TMV48100.1 hypothetical protein FE783_19295 [Paenibacillus mesophilus]
MHPNKVIPVAATGYTRKWFSLDLESTDLSGRPHLKLIGYSDALFALRIGDGGLESLGVKRGDYLLFSTTAPLKSSGQISLVRQEDEYMIRETYWSGDMTELRVPGEAFPSLSVPTENIRIAAVLSDVIKDNELAPIVRFD